MLNETKMLEAEAKPLRPR